MRIPHVNIVYAIIASLYLTIPVFSQQQRLEIDTTPRYPISVVNSLYTEAIKSPNIDDVKSWKNYLFVTVRYLEGDQKLEIWDVRNPSAPRRIQRLDFGNIKTTPTDHWKFPYVTVFDDTIIIRSNMIDYLYQLTPDGQFTQIAETDFAKTICGMKNNEESLYMSQAGNYGAYFGRLYDPYEVPPEEEYGYSILNFTNPTRPFSVSGIPNDTLGLFQDWSGDLNSTMGNIPCRIGVKDNQLVLQTDKNLSNSQVDVFWDSRIPSIFNTEEFNTSVRGSIENVIHQFPLNQTVSTMMDQFFNDLQIDPNRTVEEAILAGYEQNEKVQTLLTDYKINLNDSVRIAVQKVVAAHLSIDLEKQFSASLYSPLIDEWLNKIFAIPVDVPKEELIQTITDIINNGLSEETVGRYLLDNYIAPYVDVPDWMYWSMEDLVDHVANSDAGEAISTTIGAAYEVATAHGFVDQALDFVPAAKQFYLPAGFPKDCKDILDYAFFENGAKLKRDGLAFIEMLKFYQYYNGNTDYPDYQKQFTEAIQSLQKEYAGALVDTLEPFLSTISYAGSIQERMQSYAESIPCKMPITLAISETICNRLIQAGIDVDASVQDVFKVHQLYLSLEDQYGLTDADLAQIQNLIPVLQDELQVSQTKIKDLWDEAKSNITPIENACRDAMVSMLREAWGELDIDSPFQAALKNYIGNQVDFHWTFGVKMDDLLENFVYSAITDYPPFIDLIAVWDRAVQGDTIARWQVTFQTASEVAAITEWSQSLSITYESIAQTLGLTYQEAMTAAVKSLLLQFASVLANDMFGNFSHWGSTNQPEEYVLSVNDLTQLKPIRTEAFTWENRAGLVVRESWDYIHPRRVSLVLFDPSNPNETKQEAILDSGWGNVDYVHSCNGIVMIGGDYYDGIWPTPTAMLLSLQNNHITENRLKDPHLASAEGMLTVNHNTNLVLFGPGGLFLLSNPTPEDPGVYDPETRISEWMLYKNSSLNQ